MNHRKQLFLLIVFFFFVSSLYSQNIPTSKPEKKGPTVGLVLSGGGAKGFAYIGLMKVLREVNMPIDYIGGSSMGAITAALFSLGYSPETIADLVRGYDWDALINDIQDRRYMAYEEKLFSERSIYSIPVEDKFLSLNKSLSTSFNIDLMLNQLLASGAHVDNFSDLPIPFLCIGTDLLTGEAVVLKKGDLPRAVRASMSIPGFFPPVKYDGHYLVDGGVVNNYPAEQVKAMGADIILGGDVQSGLIKNIDEIGSMASIIDQIIGFNRVDANKKGYELTDYIVKIKMPYGMMDFNKFDSIIAIGEKVAREHYDDLKALADSINNLRGDIDKKHDIKAPETVKINTITWANPTYKNRYEGFFDDIPNHEITFAKLNERMHLLNGTKNFNDLHYEFENAGDKGLDMKIIAGSTNKGSLGAGIHYDNNYQGSILLNLAFRNIKGGRAKFFTDIVLSSNPRLKTMFIINNGFKPGFGMESDFYSFGFSEYENGHKINYWKFENFSAGAFMPMTIKNNYLFKVGFQYELFRFKQDVVTAPDLEDYYKFASYGNLYFSYNHDSRDKINFTETGHYVELKFKYVFPFSNQWSDILANGSILYLKYNYNVKIANKLVYQPRLFLGYTFTNSSSSSDVETRIPSVQHLFGFGGQNNVNYVEGFVPFAGLKFVERLGLYAGMVSTNFQYEFLPKLYATALFDVGVNESVIDFDTMQLLVGYGAKLSYNSFVGPIEFSLMSSNIDKSLTGFLSLGFWF